MTGSISDHRVSLARELLDDIELSRLAPEQLLLKTSRLARVVDAPEIRQWLQYELNGYNSQDPVALKYMERMGRFTDKEKLFGWWIPLAQINGQILAADAQFRGLRVPDVTLSLSSSNTYELVAGFGGSNVQQATKPAQDVLSKMQALANTISVLSGVRSRVLAMLHEFVANEYYELAFKEVASSIFDRYRLVVERELGTRAADVLEKIPSIYDRLSVGDPEAISQALTTCRRVIHAFADSIFPPQEGQTEVDGRNVEIGKAQYLNRIDAYVAQKCQSDTRRTRLRRTTRDLHDRVSAGVHSDVGLDEARALFLQTYLTLGEISLLGIDDSPKTEITPNTTV